MGEHVDALEAQQGDVSSHLASVTWCGFIETRRQGKHIYDRITGSNSCIIPFSGAVQWKSWRVSMDGQRQREGRRP